jgi:zinc protease
LKAIPNLVVCGLLSVTIGGHATELPQIRSHSLANGLTVLVTENHAVPLVTIEIGVKNGSMTEPPEYNGLSHLYEHMFFKGNAAIPTQEAYFVRVGELGMRWQGTTNTERVNYYFTTTSDRTDDAMVFMRDAIVSPLFDPKELERERTVVTGEIDRKEATPSYHLFEALQRRVWWKYPSRKIPIGTLSTVLKATPAQMRTIQQRYYVPNNSVLVVTGDVTAADVFAQADTLYDGWKRAPDPFVRYPLVKHPPIRATEVLVVEQPVHLVTGRLVWQGPSSVGPSAADSYAANVLSTVLNEPSSAFHKALVDSGVCVSAGIDWLMQVSTGPITIYFEAAPEKASTCAIAVLAELGNLEKPEYASDADLRRAAHALEAGEVQGRQRPSEFAHTLTYWWTSAGLDYYGSYVDKLFAVTHADVVHYVHTFITGKPFIFAVMVSPEMTAQGLDRAHFEALLGVGKRPR